MSDRYGWEVPISTKGVPIRSAIGAKEPVAHPKNCCHECPYGYDRAFCFPCYAKIMGLTKEDGGVIAEEAEA